MEDKFQEIVIGLVAPIGTDLSAISKAIKDRVEKNNFLFKEIKITDYFCELGTLVGEDLYRSDDELKKYNEFQKAFIKMQTGSEIRKKSGYCGILSRLAIRKIKEERNKFSNRPVKADEGKKVIVYLIRQLKRTEEIDVLNSVYGNSFIQLSVQDTDENIKRLLRARFLENYSSLVNEGSDKVFIESIGYENFYTENLETQVHQLIQKDFAEVDSNYEEWGQGVSECFDKGHYFMHCGVNQPAIADQIDRFFKLLFNHPLIQPTFLETSMFHAFGQAKRSLDLSRPIGAVITNKDNEILAVGCNDVNGLGLRILFQMNTDSGS